MTLSSRERVLRSIRRERTDCVAVAPYMYDVSTVAADVSLLDYYTDADWGGFSTACNIFVNSLTTDQYIYMPTFNSPHDAEMLAFIQSHTDKEVVPVPAQDVCFMGGSVRCLSWQLKGANAATLLGE